MARIKDKSWQHQVLAGAKQRSYIVGGHAKYYNHWEKQFDSY